MARIGIFDSGVGGLTVVRAVMERCPGASIYYLGDTARVPYGPKSPATVRSFAEQDGDFLARFDLDALVVACNTASAVALPGLKNRYEFPVLGVLEPGARAACRLDGPIGVIGTVGTMRSGAYERAIRRERPDAQVISIPCPLFVPLVEEGLVDHPATRLLAEDYLAPFKTTPVSSLVLGCTHYPLLASVISSVVGDQVTLVDSAVEVARELESLVDRASASDPNHRFFVTDPASRFPEVGERFLGEPIVSVEHAPLEELTSLGDENGTPTEDTP